MAQQHEADIKAFSDAVQKLEQTYGELVSLLARTCIDKENPLYCIIQNDLTRNAYGSLFHSLGLLDFDRQMMDQSLIDELHNGQWYQKTSEEKRMFFMNQAFQVASRAQCIFTNGNAMSVLQFPEK